VSRGPRLALAAAVILLAAAPGPAGSREAPDETSPAVIGRHYEEVLNVARELERNNDALRRNRDNGTRLARRVEVLKKSPAGVMRDAQLQDALRSLRGAIAEERRLRDVAASLGIGLRTQRLALAQEAGTAADHLTGEGRDLVRSGDLEGARRNFEAAYDLLTLPVEVPRETAPMPAEKPDPKVDVRPKGDESPDELRALALILRDGADRSAYNAQLWAGLLRRLRAERANLAALLDLTPPATAARTEVRDRLDARLDEVEGEIVARRRAQGRLLAEAAFLERQAGLNELAMLKDAAVHSPEGSSDAPLPGPEAAP
jgi:hypothetical protein